MATGVHLNLGIANLSGWGGLSRAWGVHRSTRIIMPSTVWHDGHLKILGRAGRSKPSMSPPFQGIVAGFRVDDFSRNMNMNLGDQACGTKLSGHVPSPVVVNVSQVS